MRQRSLRTMLSFRFALVVLFVVALISIVSNLLIHKKFGNYVMAKHKMQAEDLVKNISYQYDSASGKWNFDSIQGLGIYALNDGYVLTLYDTDSHLLWSAKDYDTKRCLQIINSQDIEPETPVLSCCKGTYDTQRYDLEQNGRIVGFLEVGYSNSCCWDENDTQFITVLNRILIGAAVISLIVAIIMGILLARSIVAPVQKTAAIANLISSGDYSIRFQDKVRARELSELAQSVNQMADSLEKQEGMRRRMTSDIAHELRTPIANVASYLEAIIDGIWDATPERLQSCYNELQRISGLVSELEHLQQIEEENLKLQKTEVDLLELSQIVSENFKIPLQEKHLHCEVRGAHTIVLADREKMQQVVTNLLSNAIKYSNENGTIRVTLEDTEKNGILTVEDEGIGIAETDLELIFERFYRTDKSRNRKTGGVGIGLTIVKTIVLAHGGSISAESEEGHGSRFIVTLPKNNLS